MSAIFTYKEQAEQWERRSKKAEAALKELAPRIRHFNAWVWFNKARGQHFIDGHPEGAECPDDCAVLEEVAIRADALEDLLMNQGPISASTQALLDKL